MGKYLHLAGRGLVKRTAPWAFALGAVYWLVGAGAIGLSFWFLTLVIAELPNWVAAGLTAILLKPFFASRMLLAEVTAVENSLLQSLTCGRVRLAHIVSRDTTGLTADDIRQASLESLAENLSDSVIAPLFWFALFGLPGAAVYRFANTADAMWGYRGDWEWAGKFAARADDLLSLVPARVTAFILICGGTNHCNLLRLWHEAKRTPSPNSGWPMSALALRLGIRLEKRGVYVLNAQGSAPSSSDVGRAVRLVSLRTWIAAFVLATGAELLGRVLDV